MPNYCYYSMCVKGKKENVEEFIKVMQADYDYGTKKFSYDRHLFRVFEANCSEFYKEENDVYKVFINGECAWSVMSCMFEDNFSYYKRFKEDYPNDFRGTTLTIESERLNLDIEVYSEECGMCFQEHYLIRQGKLEIEECVDWCECYKGDFETKEDAEEELKIEITDEEWNDDSEYISCGGFDSWDFVI